MALLLILYAVSMAVATFVENDYGAPVAQHAIYKAWWFELIQVLLIINMIGNVFKYKLYKKEKYSILLFHVAFIIIIVGAGVTRYIGREGMMHIREGETTNIMSTRESFVQYVFSEGEKESKFNDESFISPRLAPKYNNSFEFNGKNIDVELKNIIPNPQQTIVEVLGGKPILEIAFSNRGQLDRFYLEDKEVVNIGPLNFSLGEEKNDVVFLHKDSKLFVQTNMELQELAMTGGADSILKTDTINEIKLNQLYSVANQKFVITGYHESARISYVPGDTKSDANYFALEFNLKSGNETKKAEIIGASGSVGKPVYFELNNIYVSLSYGAKEVELPFSLQLKDFQLERYPGSNSPSSYASEVVLIDKEKNLNKDHRIYMNNVLDHRGYRFFQSSYDRDEQGTVLSVNKDKAGTIMTYIGYLLLSLGMFWSIFNKNSYFIELLKRTSEIRNKRKGIATVALVLLTFGAEPAIAQNTKIEIDKDHADKFGQLLVQDNGGRIKPFNTLTNELLRKISRKDKFLDWSSNQVFLGIMFNPDFWKGVEMIKISDPGLKEKLGVDEKYLSFNDLVNLEKQEYILRQYVTEAFEKEPAKRNTFDKEVIKVDERVNIFYQILNGGYLRVFPMPGEPNHKWMIPGEANHIKDSLQRAFALNAFANYYNAVLEASKSGNWSSTEGVLKSISDFQITHGSEIIPSEGKLKAEIRYINHNIFESVYKYYGMFGFLFLIVLFIGIFRPKMKLKIATITFTIILSLLFLYHTYGLILRWYVSGHAPWSNGYESMIYIAWATMLAGILFVRRSPITLATTSLLASITLMVAHLSWMDPEITNLVPVLKSYWLTIHVSVITASYGFLALAALLGFLGLVLMIFKNKKNIEHVDLTISELTNVNHVSIIIGLYLLTIGTFLGGVWANESWGRYWGWDPKETWALITIIVYSFVTHMRFIPSMNNKFAFNFATLISFGSVLMTYFGVNYYLSGLHSYASGDPVPVPSFVYYTLGIVFIVSIAAFLKNKSLSQEQRVDTA